MSPVIVVGVIAAIASTVSYAPQAWRIIKTREIESLSVPAYALSVVAFTAWTVYGILLAEWPLIVTNAVCLMLSTFILVMLLLPRNRRDAVADALEHGAKS